MVPMVPDEAETEMLEHFFFAVWSCLLSFWVHSFRVHNFGLRIHVHVEQI